MESARPVLFLLLGICIGYLITELVLWPIMDFKSQQNRMGINHSLDIEMSEKVRVLCYINTNSSNHKLGAQAVLRTWGRKCNKLIFFSSQSDSELPGSVALSGEEHRVSWKKTKNALKYLYDHHLAEAEWFLEANDDTYVVMENLRYMLYPYSPKVAIFFGSPGIVMSRAALRRFVEKALPDPSKCEPKNTGFTMGKLKKCLKNVNVVEGNSRDYSGRRRMYLVGPEATYKMFLRGDQRFWFWNGNSQEIIFAWSNYPVSFHYVQHRYMHGYEYIIYRLRTFGRKHEFASLPEIIITPKNMEANFGKSKDYIVQEEADYAY